MIEKIEYLIIRHTDLMDMCSTCSKRMLSAAQEGNVDLADQESFNRERLVNIISKVQSAIEAEIKAVSLGEGAEYLVSMVKAWNNDLELWLESIGKLDQEILTALDEVKSKTTQEISSTFQNKEKIKGYNLSSVKK
jgi:translation initiation factor 2B subunit (eIF-2B alpha/beta/delta family)